MFDDDDIRSAIDAERHHDRVAKCIHMMNGPVLFTEEYRSAIYLERLMTIAQRLERSKEPVSKLVKTRVGRYVARLTIEGRQLQSACMEFTHACCIWIGGSQRYRYEGHKLHPTLDVMLTSIAKMHEKVSEAVILQDQWLLHHSLDDLAYTIRGAFGSAEFKATLRNHQRNAELKLRRALGYLISLFRQHSRLLILRVDLYVREEAKVWSYSEEADMAFDKFCESLCQNKIVPDVLGWMSAREDGIERGQHYHVLVAVDGHKHRAGANLARMLGEYWVNECVGSERIGSYFNVFALVPRYKHLGIGLVHCTDGRKLLGLFYAVRYLCKEDVQLIATGNRTRNFRRGIELKEAPRLGAPRRGGDNLSIAKAVLFGLLRPINARQKRGGVSVSPDGTSMSPDAAHDAMMGDVSEGGGSEAAS